MRNPTIDIHTRDGVLTVPITDKSTRKQVLGSEDSITLSFKLSDCVRLHTGDYIDDEIWGRFYLLSDYMPRYNTTYAGYDYQVRFDAQYYLWKNKIFKYIPEYGGQECSWTLTAKPSVFLQVIKQNIDYYGFRYLDKEGEHEYAWNLKNRIFPDGTVVDYDAKAITLSFSNSSIIDALTSIAQTLEAEWWVDGSTIWIGRCENFRGEYKMEEGHEVQQTDGDGNPVWQKNEDGYILVDGEKVPVYEPYTRPVSLEPFIWEGQSIRPNAETMSVQDGKTQYANRIYVFGSETNIPHYYRKKLVFSKNQTCAISRGGQVIPTGFLDSFRILSPMEFRESVRTYKNPESKQIVGTYEVHDTISAGEKKEVVIQNSGESTNYMFSLTRGLAGLESADFRASVAGAHIQSVSLVIAVVAGTSEAATLYFDLTQDGDMYSMTGIPYTEFKIGDAERVTTGMYQLEYRLTILSEEGTYEDQEITMTIGTSSTRFTLVTHNRNPRIDTTGYIIEGGKNINAKFVLNPYYYPYNSAYAKGFTAKVPGTKPGNWVDYDFSGDFSFTMEGLIRGKLKGSYFTNDAKNEIAVNGIVQKRLMLPLDMSHTEFDEIRSNPDYADYFLDENTGKGRVDDGDPDVNEVIEQVVIDDTIHPNAEEEVEEVTLKTDTETDDDGNETTTYYYMVRGGAFQSFTKDFLLDKLQIVFGANENPDGGKLNGMTFDAELRRIDGVSWFRVVPNDDYAVTLPNEVMFPSVGDKYALVNYDPSFVGDTMIYNAEKRLLKAAYDYMKEMKRDKKVYTFGLMSDSSKELMDGGAFFRIGDVVTMMGGGFGSQQSRVTGIEMKLDLPYDTPSVTCGESSAYSRIGAMEGKLDSLKYKGSTYSGASSGAGGLNIYVIKTDDRTQPSNYNLMSAARTMEEIRKGTQEASDKINDKLSRVDDDSAEGNITFEKTTTHNGQTTHNADAIFNQHFDLPSGAYGRIAGTLLFHDTITDENTLTTPNGSISHLGYGRLKKLELTGPVEGDTLDVTGTSLMRDIIGPYSGSVRFEDGFTGHGFRIWKDENNAYHVTTDHLTVRQQMKVFELLIQKIRSTAGSIVVSDANGKIKRVEEMTIASENDTWLIWFETDHDFAAGDIMRVQSWKGLGTSAGSYENTSWWGVVGAVRTLDGEKVVLMSKSTWSGSVPKEGDEVVQWGNTGVSPGRDKILYLTAAENDTMGISMYEGVNTINGGTLTLKIGDLEGINTSTFGGLHGWGLYAQSVYLESDNIAGSDGKTISQKFQVADGKLESAIDGMRAKTSGDSIVKNHDLADVTDNYPDYWHPYDIDGAPLSDTTSILSDGHTALGAYGTGEAYTAYFDDGVNRYVRIINTGESADCGIYQDVGDMRQDLWASGETRTAKNVSFSFRYRMTAGSEMSVYFHSGFMSREGVCDSSVTSDTYTIYGLKKALTADGKWHTATYFGTYVGGSGQLRFLAKGTVDVTDVECLVAEELQYTNSRFVQTDERITAEVAIVSQHIDGQVEVLSGRISTEAGRISALSTKVNTLDGDVQELKTSGFVAEGDFAGLFTANLHDAPGFYDVTYDEQGNPVYTLKLITLQSAEAAAQSEISSYIASDLDQDLTDRNVARESDVSQLRSDTLSTFVSGNEMTAQLSGYYEKDSNGKLVYWTTEDEDYKASDWDNPTSTPTEGKKYFVVTYTEGGVTTNRLAVYDKWKMSDPDARVIEFVPKFTIKAQISTFLSFKHDENGDPIYAKDSDGNIIYIDGVPQREVEGNVMMKADNIIQIADKIQAVAREMTFTADHINFNGYVNANGLKIDTDGNVTTFGVVNNGRLSLVYSNLSDYLYGSDKYLDVLRCPPTLYVDAVTKITLPCAWLAYDGAPVESGRTKFTSNHDTETESSDNGWYEHNLADLRAMIGKKIRIYIANPTSGIYADLLVLVSGHEIDYDTGDMGVFNGTDEPVITPAITKQWVCYPLPDSRGRKFDPIGVISEAGASNAFLECECKTGKWKGSECIYWEVKAVVNTLDVRYETE